jgi:hypothetical protein
MAWAIRIRWESRLLPLPYPDGVFVIQMGEAGWGLSSIQRIHLSNRKPIPCKRF